MIWLLHLPLPSEIYLFLSLVAGRAYFTDGRGSEEGAKSNYTTARNMVLDKPSNNLCLTVMVQFTLCAQHS